MKMSRELNSDLHATTPLPGENGMCQKKKRETKRQREKDRGRGRERERGRRGGEGEGEGEGKLLLEWDACTHVHQFLAWCRFASLQRATLDTTLKTRTALRGAACAAVRSVPKFPIPKRDNLCTFPRLCSCRPVIAGRRCRALLSRLVTASLCRLLTTSTGRSTSPPRGGTASPVMFLHESLEAVFEVACVVA